MHWVTISLLACLTLLVSPATAGTFSWLNVGGWWAAQRTPSRTPTHVPTPTATPTPVIPAEQLEPVVLPQTPPLPSALPLATYAPPARITHTTLLPTAGGWAVLWLVHTGDLWDARVPSALWYAHVGVPEVPAMPLVEIHRIDRFPVCIPPAISPDGREIAVVVNELTNWRTATRTSGRTTHQWFGRLALDGTWALPLQKNRPIETRLGVHGGIGHMVWTEGR